MYTYNNRGINILSSPRRTFSYFFLPRVSKLIEEIGRATAFGSTFEKNHSRGQGTNNPLLVFPVDEPRGVTARMANAQLRTENAPPAN